MKKRIFWVMAALSLVLMILAGLSMSGVYYRLYQTEIKQTLKTHVELMAHDAEDGEEPVAQIAQLQQLLGPTMRTTYVTQDGTVLYDSQVEAASMENHGDRQEIRGARENGWGEALRRSESVHADTYYYAVRLSDGTVLRISQTLNRMSALFAQSIPILALVLGAILVLAVIVAKGLTDSMMEPILQASNHLDEALEGNAGRPLVEMDTYEELAPFLGKIDQLNDQMREKIQKIREQQDTLHILIEHMDEGFVLIDPGYRVLLMNPSARRLLRVPEKTRAEGENFLHVNRDIRLQQALRKSMNREESARSVMLERNQYFLTPVVGDDGRIQGIVMLVMSMDPALRAEQSRRDFAANVSHELKTPLTSIHGFAELMAGHMVPPEDAEPMIQRIYKESGRLIRLVDDIIRLSQIENRPDAEPRELAALDQIARETCARLEPTAREKGVTLITHLEPAVLPIRPAYAEELFNNLIDNAVKYNKPGGEVEVWVKPAADKIQIRVADTGIGMEPHHLDRIFERFYRVDKSRSKQTGGTGLGLSIVKHIVENLQGTIRVDSQPDRGTTFTLEIPKKQPADLPETGKENG